MKELSAFRVALITNLEPVYGIILAFLFFGKREQMTLGFYVGALLILGTIFIFPYIKNIKGRKISKPATE
jgi:drug/metabolite transporter (DMT)-like permease